MSKYFYINTSSSRETDRSRGLVKSPLRLVNPVFLADPVFYVGVVARDIFISPPHSLFFFIDIHGLFVFAPRVRKCNICKRSSDGRICPAVARTARCPGQMETDVVSTLLTECILRDLVGMNEIR